MAGMGGGQEEGRAMKLRVMGGGIYLSRREAVLGYCGFEGVETY